jgi:hypothetical protein
MVKSEGWMVKGERCKMCDPYGGRKTSRFILGYGYMTPLGVIPYQWHIFTSSDLKASDERILSFQPNASYSIQSRRYLSTLVKP